MTSLFDQTQAAVAHIRTVTAAQPTIGIILGTGLGGLVDHVDVEHSIDYATIPHFPVSTVESHKGRLIFGTIGGHSVVVMQGRFHLYEGYSAAQAAFPVRVMKLLGVRTMIVSNACGGMNPLFRRGDVMLIDDHINLLGDNPLIGPNDDRFGPRFPDMSEPYSQHLLSLAERCALSLKLKVHRGVYVAVAGPNLETRAEYRFLRTIGADVVGMSTVPEVIAARHMNMDVLGISIITDECFPDSLQPVRLEDVLAAAAIAEPNMTALVREVLANL
ncbi:MAG: purine-nucleoside phosphorylase [Candidatus Kapabacteria bacterium]|jgi:purine-nucleoside phosphorylase|nr:purine-nucleoside phosphorylase [Candidatus Kapabacteria bacterium]